MSPVMQAVMVATGGALGALSRWGVGLAAVRLGFAPPLGTLAANILGCFCIGLAKAAVDAAGWGTEPLRMFVFTGFLGAFTTFSTFEADTVMLWREDARMAAAGYMLVSVVGGIAAFVAGWALMQRLAQ